MLGSLVRVTHPKKTCAGDCFSDSDGVLRQSSSAKNGSALLSIARWAIALLETRLCVCTCSYCNCFLCYWRNKYSSSSWSVSVYPSHCDLRLSIALRIARTGRVVLKFICCGKFGEFQRRKWRTPPPLA